jgi:NADH dehydrogenase
MLMDLTLSLAVGGPARAGLPVTLIGEARRRHSFIAARDVAAFAVEAARRPVEVSRRVIIGGPEALSLRDVVATYGRVLGRTIPVDFKAPGELIPNLPPVPGLAEVVSSMVGSLEMFESPIDMAETARTFGVRITSLEDFVKSERVALPA